MKELKSLEEFNAIIAKQAAVLAYFSHQKCNVCKVLKPKIESLMNAKFPKIETVYCDTENTPDIAASLSIFAVPTIVIWFEGKETYRFSRNLGLQELNDALNRPYSLFFD